MWWGFWSLANGESPRLTWKPPWPPPQSIFEETAYCCYNRIASSLRRSSEQKLSSLHCVFRLLSWQMHSRETKYEPQLNLRNSATSNPLPSRPPGMLSRHNLTHSTFRFPNDVKQEIPEVEQQHCIHPLLLMHIVSIWTPFSTVRLDISALDRMCAQKSWFSGQQVGLLGQHYSKQEFTKTRCLKSKDLLEKSEGSFLEVFSHTHSRPQTHSDVYIPELFPSQFCVVQSRPVQTCSRSRSVHFRFALLTIDPFLEVPTLAFLAQELLQYQKCSIQNCSIGTYTLQKCCYYRTALSRIAPSPEVPTPALLVPKLLQLQNCLIPLIHKDMCTSVML